MYHQQCKQKYHSDSNSTLTGIFKQEESKTGVEKPVYSYE